jgi:hypothetical protein
MTLEGISRTYAKTIEALEEELESHIISYTEFSDEEHATDSLINQDKLTHYVNFDDIKRLLNEKYEEE